MYYFNSAVKDLESNQAPVSLQEIISNSVTAEFTEQSRKRQSENSTFQKTEAFSCAFSVLWSNFLKHVNDEKQCFSFTQFVCDWFRCEVTARACLHFRTKTSILATPYCQACTNNNDASLRDGDDTQLDHQRARRKRGFFLICHDSFWLWYFLEPAVF